MYDSEPFACLPTDCSSCVPVHEHVYPCNCTINGKLINMRNGFLAGCENAHESN